VQKRTLVAFVRRQRCTPDSDMELNDRRMLMRAVELAREAESRGNLPVGAVIALNDRIIAEGASAILAPKFNPGKHAEIEALRAVPDDLWPQRRAMTCYTTLEPCVMCFGALVLHGIGRVVFGARDPDGGAGAMLAHLPPYYQSGRNVPVWDGPVAQDICDDLGLRTATLFGSIDGAG